MGSGVSHTRRLVTETSEHKSRNKSHSATKRFGRLGFRLAIPKTGLESATDDSNFQATPVQVGEAGLGYNQLTFAVEVYRQLAAQISVAKHDEEVARHAPQSILHDQNCIQLQREHLN
jgi:hypothetical protein